MAKRSLADRFKEKYIVDEKTGCWLWRACKNKNGYGLFRSNVGTLAHRFSYTQKHGLIPKSESYHGICVLHKCDQPSCVNPDHLFIGTHKDNMEDMKNKNRAGCSYVNRGSGHKLSKLFEPEVILIKKFLKRHPTVYRQGQCAFLANWFNVTVSTVSAINTNKRWSHVEAYQA